MTKTASDMRDAHRHAMVLAQRAELALVAGATSEATGLFRQAFEAEEKVALAYRDMMEVEPTRSILFKGAATLAMKCRDFAAAERMIANALCGNPPANVADELRNLYEDVNFNRHLELNGVKLSASEVQFSLSGDGIGYGLAPSHQVINRIQSIETLAMRTAERIGGKPYRQHGPTDSESKTVYMSYLSTARAASYAVTMRLGYAEHPQGDFFADVAQTRVIDSMLQGIQLLDNGTPELLKEVIKDEAYFTNFVSLVKAIAPDGKVVEQVGFTVLRNEQVQTVSLRRVGRDVNITHQDIERKESSGEVERLVVKGVLRRANADKNRITIVGKSEKAYEVIVPDGMGDIVRMYWDSPVRATLQKKYSDKNAFRLIDLEGE